MKMIIVDSKTSGAQPTNVNVEADEHFLTIHFYDMELRLPVCEILQLIEAVDKK